MLYYIEIYENLSGKKLKEFLKFLECISDSYSIETTNIDNISKEEYMQMQNEAKDYINKEYCKRKKEYTYNDSYKKKIDSLFNFKTEDEAITYFKQLYKEDLEMIENKSYSISSIKKIDLEKEIDFISRKITRITDTSFGGPYAIFYFKFGYLYQNIMDGINFLFDLNIYIENDNYQNLSFQKNRIDFCNVFSEGEVASLTLEEGEYQKFKKLNIKHIKNERVS